MRGLNNPNLKYLWVCDERDGQYSDKILSRMVSGATILVAQENILFYFLSPCLPSFLSF